MKSMISELKIFFIIAIALGICFIIVEECVSPVVFGSYRTSQSTPSYENIHAMDDEQEEPEEIYVSRTDLPTLKEDGTSEIPERQS
jgi:hypothetical protein